MVRPRTLRRLSEVVPPGRRIELRCERAPISGWRAASGLRLVVRLRRCGKVLRAGARGRRSRRGRLGCRAARRRRRLLQVRDGIQQQRDQLASIRRHVASRWSGRRLRRRCNRWLGHEVLECLERERILYRSRWDLIPWSNRSWGCTPLRSVRLWGSTPEQRVKVHVTRGRCRLGCGHGRLLQRRWRRRGSRNRSGDVRGARSGRRDQLRVVL